MQPGRRMLFLLGVIYTGGERTEAKVREGLAQWKENEKPNRDGFALVPPISRLATTLISPWWGSLMVSLLLTHISPYIQTN